MTLTHLAIPAEPRKGSIESIPLSDGAFALVVLTGDGLRYTTGVLLAQGLAEALLVSLVRLTDLELLVLDRPAQLPAIVARKADAVILFEGGREGGRGESSLG